MTTAHNPPGQPPRLVMSEQQLPASTACALDTEQKILAFAERHAGATADKLAKNRQAREKSLITARSRRLD